MIDDLALAEGVVERVVDLLRREAEARRRVAVDLQRRLEPAVLLSRCSRRSAAGTLRRAAVDPRRPGRARRDRCPAACTGTARCSSARRCAGPAPAAGRSARPAPAPAARAAARSPRPRRRRARRQRLQRDEHPRACSAPTAAATAAAGEPRSRSSTSGSLPHRRRRPSASFCRMAWNEMSCAGLDRAGEPAGVLLREEALGDDHEERDVERDEAQSDRERHRPVPQDDQRASARSARAARRTRARSPRPSASPARDREAAAAPRTSSASW